MAMKSSEPPARLLHGPPACTSAGVTSKTDSIRSRKLTTFAWCAPGLLSSSGQSSGPGIRRRVAAASGSRLSPPSTARRDTGGKRDPSAASSLGTSAGEGAGTALNGECPRSGVSGPRRYGPVVAPRLPLAGQREPPVGGQRHQAVGQEGIQRPVTL